MILCFYIVIFTLRVVNSDYLEPLDCHLVHCGLQNYMIERYPTMPSRQCRGMIRYSTNDPPFERQRCHSTFEAWCEHSALQTSFRYSALKARSRYSAFQTSSRRSALMVSSIESSKASPDSTGGSHSVPSVALRDTQELLKDQTCTSCFINTYPADFSSHAPDGLYLRPRKSSTLIARRTAVELCKVNPNTWPALYIQSTDDLGD
jgi:hypothetical protein